LHPLPLLLLVALLSACAARSPGDLPPLKRPERVALSDFVGTWYVIANIPYFAERGRVGSRVEYRPRGDGRFDDLYYSRKGDFAAPERLLKGVAWPLDPPTYTRWRSRFYWPFTFDFEVLYLDPQTGHLLLGHASREYAWVMARSPDMSEQDYQALLARLAAQGYDPSRLKRVPQRPEQIGQPGFQ
jgi:apolipoprotein D and lipocalin family protein